MRKVALATTLFVFFLGAASAQNGGDESDDPISGNAALGYLATSGNTESTNVNGSFNLLYSREVWSHEFDLTAVSARNDDTTTTEAYGAVYAARRELSERSFIVTALDWERDRFSAYDEQISETVGYGRRFINTDAHALNAEIGAGARQARLTDGTEEDDAIVRGALDYVWTVSETTDFGQGLVIESGSSNTSVEAVSQLRARLFGNIALVLSYRIRRNSDVLPGTEKTDTFTAISLEYAF